MQAPGADVFRLLVADEMNSGGIDDVVINVIDGTGGNVAPVVTVSPDRTIILPVNSATITSTAALAQVVEASHLSGCDSNNPISPATATATPAIRTAPIGSRSLRSSTALV